MWIKACILSFIITAVAERLLIPFLRKLKFGQTILEDGPSWHEKKQGIPTMGGIAFILACVLSSLFFIKSEMGGAILLCAVLFGAIGFLDDYIKVVKKRNKGLSAKQKFLLQTVASLIYALYIYFGAGQSETLIPFTEIKLNLGLFYIPFVMLVLLATTNSANLTDGIDGLASSVGSIASLFFTVACIVISGNSDASVLSATLVGGLLGFLIYNAHPAKVFMGDTGSLFIGGMIAAVSVALGLELFILISAFVFLFEAVSVIIQVSVYKKTKKRVFKMAPVHHHFEMCGWKETKVVAVFSMVTAILCLIAYLAL